MLLIEGGVFLIAHAANTVRKFHAARLPPTPSVATKRPATDKAERNADDQEKQSQSQKEKWKGYQRYDQQDGGQNKTRHTVHYLVENRGCKRLQTG